jgi:hypothetical protein
MEMKYPMLLLSAFDGTCRRQRGAPGKCASMDIEGQHEKIGSGKYRVSSLVSMGMMPGQGMGFADGCARRQRSGKYEVRSAKQSAFAPRDPAYQCALLHCSPQT